MVSLNPVMIDGTGMCGCCRVVVGGVAKFACVDGPEFDGHLVDFESLADRLTTYRSFEEQARHAADECRLTLEMPPDTLTVKDRLAIPRVHMPELDADIRSRNFEEVNRGLDYQQAVLEALRCQRMELGPPDESGRSKPVPIGGSEYDIAVDVVVNAVGTGANPLLTASAPHLKLNKWGNITVDDTGATSIPGAFAGGDIVRGGATVILAMGDGKQAAAAINGYLKGDL